MPKAMILGARKKLVLDSEKFICTDGGLGTPHRPPAPDYLGPDKPDKSHQRRTKRYR